MNDGNMRKNKRALTEIFAFWWVMADTAAYAQPQLGEVVAGEAIISNALGTTFIQQSSPNAILDWHSFSVSENHTVQFNQPSADSAILNRVTGHLESQINGEIRANGQVFLVNPNGVVIGEHGVITTGGFVASTLDISNEHFAAGRYEFSGDGGKITNLGTIKALDGDVVLMAGHLVNQGNISSENADVLLAAGTKVLLSNTAQPRLFVQSDIPMDGTGIDAGGLIAATEIEMLAAGGAIYDLAINQTGVARASGVDQKDGRILLTSDNGAMNISGSLKSGNEDGSGGTIFIGGGLQGKNDAIDNAAMLTVGEDAVIDVSATERGDGGTAVLWSNGSTSFLGSAFAQGGRFSGQGGLVEVSGKRMLNFRPQQPINLMAPAGQPGTLLLDPDDLLIVNVQGQRPIPDKTDGPPVTYTASNGEYTGRFDMGSSELTVASLLAALNAGNVILQASGDILTPDEPVDVDWSTSGTNLTLNAGESIDVSGNFNAGTGNVFLRANGNLSVGQLQAGTIEAGLLDIGAKDSSSALTKVDIIATLDVGQLNLDMTGQITGDVNVKASGNVINSITSSGAAANLTGRVDIRSTGTNENTALNVQLDGSAAASLQFVSQGDLSLADTVTLGSSGGDIVLASTDGSLKGAGLSAGVLAGFDSTRKVRLYSGSHQDLSSGQYPATATLLTGETFTSLPPSSVTQSGTVLIFRAGGGTLSLRANDLTRLYGDPNPTLTYSVSGLSNGDTFTGVTTGEPALSTSATVTSGRGTYAINISKGTLASSLYNFSFVNGTLTVNPAQLTVTPNPLSAVYGDVPTGFTYSYSGFRNSDDANIISGLPNGITVEGGLGEQFRNVGTYNITVNEGISGNYRLVDDGGDDELTITSAPLTVTFKDVEALYGSNELTNGADLTGLRRTEDAATVTVHATTSATATSDVGTYDITGTASANNYNVTTVNGSLTIKPRPVSLVFDVLSRQYGEDNPAFSARIVGNGFVNGDSLSDAGISFTTLADKTSDVGVYSVTLSANTSNYAISDYTRSNGLTITQAPLDLILGNASKVYGKTAGADLFSVSYRGLLNGDENPVLTGLTNSGLGALSDVGEYASTGGSLAAGSNYYIERVEGGTLNVMPAELNVIVGSGSKVYGDTAFTVSDTTASGLAAGQSVSDLGLVYSSTITNPLLQAGESAPVTAMLGEGVKNYTIKSVIPGTVTVQKRELSALFARRQRFYGETINLDDPTQLSYSGFVNGDGEADLDSLVVNGVHDDADTDVGLYRLTAELNDNNYYLNNATGSIQIIPRRVSVSVANGEKVYGDVFKPVVTINNLASFDSVNDPDLYDLLDVGTEQGADAGTYRLQVVLENPNYEVVSNGPGILTVNPRPIDVLVKSQSVRKPYTSVPFEIDVDNLAGTDTIGHLGLNPSFTVKIPADAPAATYKHVIDISSYDLKNPNYRVASIVPGDLEVLPDNTVVTIIASGGISVTDVTSSSYVSDEALATDEALAGDGGYNTDIEIRDSTGTQPMTTGLFNAIFAEQPSDGLASFLLSRGNMVANQLGEDNPFANLFRDYALGRITGEQFNAGIGAQEGGMGVIAGIIGDYALELADRPMDQMTEAERDLMLRLNLRTREIGYEFADRLEGEIAVEEQRQAAANRGMMGLLQASRFGDAMGRAIDGYSAEHATDVAQYIEGNVDGTGAALAGMGAFAGVAIGGTAVAGGALLALATATAASSVIGAGGAAAAAAGTAVGVSAASASGVLASGVGGVAGSATGLMTAAGTAAAVGGVFVVAAAIVTLEAVQQVLAQEREDVARDTLASLNNGYSYGEAPDFLRKMALQELLFGPPRTNTTLSRQGL